MTPVTSMTRQELCAEVKKLRELLIRHDKICCMDESIGTNVMWTPKLCKLVKDVRKALGLD